MAASSGASAPRRAASPALPPRLEALRAAIAPGASVADIACDHAKLAVAAVCTGARAAVAVDIAVGPLLEARRTVAAAGVAARVALVRANGFGALGPAVDVAVVAGVGGAKLAALIERDRPGARGLGRMLLSPHGDEELVRVALAAHGWQVRREWLVAEGRRLYVQLDAAYRGTPRALDLRERVLGGLPCWADPRLLLRFRARAMARLEAQIAGLERAALPAAGLADARAALAIWRECPGSEAATISHQALSKAVGPR